MVFGKVSFVINYSETRNFNSFFFLLLFFTFFFSFINVSLHLKEDQPVEVIKLLTMYVMETSRVVVHQPVESACIVFNMDGFTLKNMVYILFFILFFFVGGENV